MKLLKNASKTKFHPFILPSDDGVDYEASALNILQTKPEVIQEFIKNLKEQGIELNDEAKARELFLSRINDSIIYQMYMNDGFNSSLLVGKERAVLLFDTITVLDLDSLSRMFPNVENFSAENSNPEALKEMNAFMRAFLEAKLHGAEYSKEIPKEDQLSKGEIIDALLERITVQDYRAVSKFIEHVVRGHVSKKKILAPSAG